MEELKIDELGGDYVAREIIERSKNKDIIYLTEDIILNTKCVQQLSEYIENLIARNKELESDKQQLKFENNLLKQDIKNMYHQEAIISILEEEFNLNREESIEILENY